MQLLVSMHPCLSIDEIVRRVAYELIAAKGQAAAVALACCCKTFEDPVLDELWETQEGLLPLLRSFPGDIWNGDENVGATTIFALSLLNSTVQF